MALASWFQTSILNSSSSSSPVDSKTPKVKHEKLDIKPLVFNLMICIKDRNISALAYHLLFATLQDNPQMTFEGLHFCHFQWILQEMRRSRFCWAMSRLARSHRESQVNLLEAFQLEVIGAFASKMPFRIRCEFLYKQIYLDARKTTSKIHNTTLKAPSTNMVYQKLLLTSGCMCKHGTSGGSSKVGWHFMLMIDHNTPLKKQITQFLDYSHR